MLILPTAIVLSLFSKEIIFLWTQNHVTAENTSLIMSLLVIGGAINSLMNLPYALQLANGWTSLAFYINLISVIVLVPIIIVLTLHLQAVGAAIAWIILNSGYVLFAIPIIHRYLLPGEKWRWYREDVGFPLLVAFSIGGAGRWLVHGQMSPPVAGVVLLSIYVAALATTSLAAPLVRTQIMGIAHRLWVTYGI